jgi:MFS family permease
MLWAGRWLAGVGVGFLVMIIPLYQSEIAHPSVRGTITSLQQFMLGIGSFVAGWVSYGTYIGLQNQGQWRLPLGLQMLPAVVLGKSSIFLCYQPLCLPIHFRRSFDHVLPRKPTCEYPFPVAQRPRLIFLQWLIDHNRPAEGLQTLARLHSNGNEQDPWVRAEFDQIQESITFEHEHEAKSYLECVVSR